MLFVSVRMCILLQAATAFANGERDYAAYLSDQVYVPVRCDLVLSFVSFIVAGPIDKTSEKKLRTYSQLYSKENSSYSPSTIFCAQ